MAISCWECQGYLYEFDGENSTLLKSDFETIRSMIEESERRFMDRG
ncbi:MAG: hypothetical protein ACOX5R_23065 [bacterium]|jgi:hypothetical protein